MKRWRWRIAAINGTIVVFLLLAELSDMALLPLLLITANLFAVMFELGAELDERLGQ